MHYHLDLGSKKIHLQKCDEKCSIVRATFENFFFKHCEQTNIDKKFYINMGYLLGLLDTEVEYLLRHNGYTLQLWGKTFDFIFESSFMCSFGRDYTIALIEKVNMELKKEFGDKSTLKLIDYKGRKQC